MASRNLGEQVTAASLQPPHPPAQRTKKAKVRVRHEPGTMNQTEARFEREYLKPLQAAGRIDAYGFEIEKVKVGSDTCWLTIDFTIVWADGQIERVDVKGGGPAEEDARVKMKAAALQYPHYHWSWWIYQGKAKGWKVVRFGDPGGHPLKEKFPRAGI